MVLVLFAIVGDIGGVGLLHVRAMDTMVLGLGHSGSQLGSSLLSPCNKRGSFPSRNLACTQSVSPVFVTSLSFLPEHQQRLAVLKIGVQGRKTDLFGSQANLISRQSDAKVAADHPEVVAHFSSINKHHQYFHHICHCQRTEQETEQGEATVDESEESWGVQFAIAALRFYKREISPLLPGSCRYVPTCSEYSMQAYRTYGVLKGTVLTAWRLARCNPLGGSGFDPPRWFGEPKPPSL